MSSYDEIITRLHMTENIVYGLITGIGIVANLVVIIVISIWDRVQANRAIANTFIVNLAIADLLFVAILPFYMPAVVVEGWRFGKFWCKFTQVIKYVNYRASILFLTTLTADRFLALVYALESRVYRTRAKGIKISVIIWIISLCFAIPVMIFTNLFDEDGKTPRCQLEFPGYESDRFTQNELYEQFSYVFLDYDGTSENSTAEMVIYPGGNSTAENSGNFSSEPDLLCLDEGHKNSLTYVAWIYINFVLFFLVPLIIIIFSYGSIIHVTFSRDVTSTREDGIHKQLAVMVALLVTVFILCWLPFQVFELLTLPKGVKLAQRSDCEIYKSTFSMFAWSNSAINPILYTISSRRFQDKLKTAWTCIVHGKRRVLEKQSSKQTMLTRLQATSGGSSKNLNVSSAAGIQSTTRSKIKTVYK